ncbi:hypothetical protein LENED_000061 [Lentinula edodes]|uniref:Uncharacterized protein n=1 Tax=Lentinula edodes TaxID=5353 RepID=A0A1Q3DUS9_LENED|nr:hypothetical protein LENED_000061 [Lentinula edodes]
MTGSEVHELKKYKVSHVVETTTTIQIPLRLTPGLGSHNLVALRRSPRYYPSPRYHGEESTHHGGGSLFAPLLVFVNVKDSKHSVDKAVLWAFKTEELPARTLPLLSLFLILPGYTRRQFETNR